jgi:membrane-associated HD superfamily phosphohydrolase
MDVQHIVQQKYQTNQLKDMEIHYNKEEMLEVRWGFLQAYLIQIFEK